MKTLACLLAYLAPATNSCAPSSPAVSASLVGIPTIGIARPAQSVQLDPKLPAYQVIPGVSGTVKTAGSNTLSQVMGYWTEGFKKSYPDVKVESEAKGSGSAPPALIAGSINFGAMSRAMKAEEIDQFQKTFGYPPTQISTCIDALAVFVHKDNPLKGLSLTQIDAIFSKTRKGGATKEIRTWGDLGLTGEWADKPISLYGRDAASGTYSYFKEHPLFNGDFRDDVKEMPGSSNVVDSIANDRYAMGYSGIGFKTAGVRALPLTLKDGGAFIEPVSEKVYAGEYPISRFLFLYVNQKPGTELDPLRREFLRYVLSKAGQADVVKAGFFPLTADLALKNGKAVEAASPKK
jgi:phosphate transport system substrate-binding protein